MKYCSQCGQSNEDSSRFCTACGSPLQIQPRSNVNFNDTPVPEAPNVPFSEMGYGAADTSGGSAPGSGAPGSDIPGAGPREEIIYTDIAPRNIALCIVFSIITCGIYGLYWIYKLNEEINELAQDPTATGGGLVILFSIITCGIYALYWAYKMGQKCDEIKQVNGSSGILFLILHLFGLGIVAEALMQDTINKVLE